jgi:hypothetical protein
MLLDRQASLTQALKNAQVLNSRVLLQGGHGTHYKYLSLYCTGFENYARLIHLFNLTSFTNAIVVYIYASTKIRSSFIAFIIAFSFWVITESMTLKTKNLVNVCYQQ